jgi:hypothetical protein
MPLVRDPVCGDVPASRVAETAGNGSFQPPDAPFPTAAAPEIFSRETDFFSRGENFVSRGENFIPRGDFLAAGVAKWTAREKGGTAAELPKAAVGEELLSGGEGGILNQLL